MSPGFAPSRGRPTTEIRANRRWLRVNIAHNGISVSAPDHRLNPLERCGHSRLIQAHLNKSTSFLFLRNRRNSHFSTRIPSRSQISIFNILNALEYISQRLYRLGRKGVVDIRIGAGDTFWEAGWRSSCNENDINIDRRHHWDEENTLIILDNCLMILTSSTSCACPTESWERAEVIRFRTSSERKHKDNDNVKRKQHSTTNGMGERDITAEQSRA